ncbi:AhpA/YtjB family protein [Pseudoalteromonas obscura]|uniref:AhpA/YtjB family protein n=1 Tax=Pseudoalteromonas obscura TaxID=3048491 RepID=A0ABT7EKV0_9GAMM|nr:AhpA/YtjB family protein [Pseudoalteromonas sp. P94(2023)]MDK2595677.1 AhpA/YtjB family protein [Pseudoalteromonas sp. P94(2023)]
MKNTQAHAFLKSSQSKRLLRLTIAAGCLLALLWIATNTSFRSHQLLHTNANHTGQSLVRLFALNAAEPLSRMDTPRLRALSNHLASDQYVLSVAVYNQKGQFLIGNDGITEAPEFQGLPDGLAGINPSKDAIVGKIVDSQQTIGFVSIEYLTDAAMSESHKHFHQLGRIVLLMLLIVGVFTWQIGRALTRRDVKKQIKKSAQEDSLIENEENNQS